MDDLNIIFNVYKITWNFSNFVKFSMNIFNFSLDMISIKVFPNSFKFSMKYTEEKIYICLRVLPGCTIS